MTRILAAAIAAASVSTAAAAPALAWTPAETVYLGLAKARNLKNTGGDQGLIAAGRAVCTALANGVDREAILAEFGAGPDRRSIGVDTIAAATARGSLCPAGTPPPRAVAPTPTRTAAPVPNAPSTVGAIAVCKDGYVWYSATRSGSCRGHGGVARWL